MMEERALTYRELAERLHCSEHTLRKNKQWRQLPHFFIGDGRQTLKSARFHLSDVLYYLKERDGSLQIHLKNQNRE